MMKNFVALIILTAVWNIPPAIAQQQQDDRGAEARAEMARLSDLAGDWVSQTLTPDADGNLVVRGEEPAHIHYMLGDLALREDAQPENMSGFAIESTIQYDQNRDLYRLVAMDDTWGNMDIYEGNFGEDGVLRLTNLRSGTSYVAPDGSQTSFRLSFTIHDHDHNEFLVEQTLDSGASWSPMVQYNRRRATE
jgi:hypothetical protein